MKTTIKSILLTTAIILGIGTNTFAQSPTIQKFDEEAKGAHLFLYQSVIRMLNKDQNPDFNMLIKDLDYLKFIMTDSLSSSPYAGFNSLNKSLTGEGYGELMMFDNKDYKGVVYEKENEDGNSNWVATFAMAGRYGLFEMNGSLDPKYFSAMKSLNMKKLETMLPLDDMGAKSHSHNESK